MRAVHDDAGVRGWSGYTHDLPVSVEVDGQTSECRGACTFQYTNGWYHTPRIYSLSPAVVEEGTLVTVDGRFHSKPFEFEELRDKGMVVFIDSVDGVKVCGQNVIFFSHQVCQH